HSGTAERVGVQIPDSKLVMFGNPTKGAAVMLAAPLAGLDLPLKVLVWEDATGVVSVSCNTAGSMAERHHLDSALRAHYDAVESIVDAAVGPSWRHGPGGLGSPNRCWCTSWVSRWMARVSSVFSSSSLSTSW